MDNVYCFLVLKLYYSLQERSNCFVTEKTILFQGSRGIQHFPGGGGGVGGVGGIPASIRGGGGVHMLISI